MGLNDLTFRTRNQILRGMLHLSSPPLRVRQHKDFLFVEKLEGFNTHAPDLGRKGLFELLQREWGDSLHVVHRLDKGTSGAMVFARSAAAAARFGEMFERHVVRKRYWFLTDRKSKTDAFSRSSKIEKKGSAFVSDPDSADPNAKTLFRRLKNLPLGELWEASPETGKPHQIRLHAADAGLPILGDHEHGGTAFPRLCLHSKLLAFQWEDQEELFEASIPGWAESLPPVPAIIADAAQSRFLLYDLEQVRPTSQCFRLVHRETEICRIDQFSSQWVVNWYASDEPSKEELSFFEGLAKKYQVSIFIWHRPDRGRDPQSPKSWKVGDVKDRWEALENEVRFELRLDSGLSAGLFLDQRANRAWVRHTALDQKVLNLFSYTGAFSLNAALGGASEVCTVDVSAKFNDWAQQNFRLNNLDPSLPAYEFWNQDCGLFLQGAVKRRRKWDLILCDPPSFGRSKEGVFQIQKHLPAMIENCLECLSPKGRLLLSCNYEGWTTQDLRKVVQGARGLHRLRFLEAPEPGLDFERPDVEPLMKTVLVLKDQ